MVRHHPSDELLLDYAAGSSPEALSLVVATHLALCPACRAEVERLEQLGGALLGDLAPAPFPDDLLRQLMHRIDNAADSHEDSGLDRLPDDTASGDSELLPRPLRDCIGRPLGELRWRRLGPYSVLQLIDGAAAKTHLLRIKPGSSIPQHSHDGLELALVLAGGLSDERGHYRRGDISQADSSVTHGQLADRDEDCLCLVATDGPLKLTGPLGRLFNPLIRL